ncbi:MAG: hypothetical protein JRJ45_14110 [Deltaproteobacteria bacterium]|nr:hypothetical protein [Deltaproteobacteria bacterium]
MGAWGQGSWGAWGQGSWGAGGQGDGVRVTSPEEIAPAIRQGFASGKPSIINVEVNKKYPSPFVESYEQMID